MLQRTRCHAASAVSVRSHVGLKHTPLNFKELHAAFVSRNFTSCVWPAKLAEVYRLVRQGEQPTTVAPSVTYEVSTSYYNLDQLISLHRTANGSLFPFDFQRQLNSAERRQVLPFHLEPADVPGWPPPKARQDGG
jgi:hypothetical protein